MRVRIFVSLKKGVLDPQGKAIERSLHTFGYNGVQDVRVGKFLELEVEAAS
ncbi:MAG: phosphoribosylformylglycinamidine synthase subunit PurS, partial [Candidatus Binatia bacterium]